MIADTEQFEFYDVAKVANILGIKKERVRYWCQNGTIEAINLNAGEPGKKYRRFRISKQSLQNFIESKKHTPPPAPQQRRRPRKNRRYT